MSDVVDLIGIVVSAIVILSGYMITQSYNRRSNLSDRVWSKKLKLYNKMKISIAELIQLIEFEEKIIVKSKNSPFSPDRTLYFQYNFEVKLYLDLFHPDISDMQCYERYKLKNVNVKTVPDQEILDLIDKISDEFAFLKIQTLSKIRTDFDATYYKQDLVNPDEDLSSKVYQLFDEIFNFILTSQNPPAPISLPEMRTQYIEKHKNLTRELYLDLERTRRSEVKMKINTQCPFLTENQIK